MQKRKRISKIGLVMVVLAVYLLTFVIGTLIGNQLQGGSMIPSISGITGSGRLNILFMGIDARSNEENSRSDTMILASIDKKTKKAVLIWIPRDTRVEVAAGRYDKINSVNYLQGPEQACQVVSDLLGIKVKYYAVTNFDGFAEIVDILGGVHIDVENNMYHPDPDPKLRINLSRGMQLLNGEDALRYVRYRGGPTADIGRTQRQAKFIKALADEMISTSTIVKLPELLPKLMENIKTNIPLNEMGTLASLARQFSGDNIITQTLPGYSYTDPSNGASYWKADEEQITGMLEALFAGESFEVMSDPPSWTGSSAASSAQPVEETPDPEENPEVETPGEETPDDPGMGGGNTEGEKPPADSETETGDEHFEDPEEEDQIYTGSEGYETDPLNNPDSGGNSI